MGSCFSKHSSCEEKRKRAAEEENQVHQPRKQQQQKGEYQTKKGVEVFSELSRNEDKQHQLGEKQGFGQKEHCLLHPQRQTMDPVDEKHCPLPSQQDPTQEKESALPSEAERHDWNQHKHRPNPQKPLPLQKPAATEVMENELSKSHSVNLLANTTHAQRYNRKEDNSGGKFPSSARKEWLSQQHPAAASSVALPHKHALARTNSSSRDPSPVETARALRAQPSSPLKRPQSSRELALDGPPRLLRTTSGKLSSPSRGGLYTSPSAQLSKHSAVEDHSSRARATEKPSLNKKLLVDPISITSKESANELQHVEVRKHSPPKNLTNLASVCDANKASKRPSTPGKESPVSRRSSNQDSVPALVPRRSRSPVQQTQKTTRESDSSLSSTRSTHRKENPSLRRTSECMAASASQFASRVMIERTADLSINSDTMSVFQSERSVAAKDKVGVGGKTRRGSRLPLQEIPDNCVLHARKQGPRDGSEIQRKTEGGEPRGIKVATDKLEITQDVGVQGKDPLEAKAESLALEGKSVLSAFKALEEYRMKAGLHSSESADVKPYTRSQTAQGKYSQKLENQEIGDGNGDDNNVDYDDNGICGDDEPDSCSSARQSCEHFLFPDVQSLLVSESREMEIDGKLPMPPSLSKACSILKAVADLNNGAPRHPKKKECPDEIEHPNLLSFQFGEEHTPEHRTARK